MITFPKDTSRLRWTRHIKNKMVFYHLSAAQIIRIFRRPDRIEEGIAPETMAAVQAKKSISAHKPKHEELWLMYQKKPNKKIILISTWRYPGKTKPGQTVPIPSEIVAELMQENWKIDGLIQKS